MKRSIHATLRAAILAAALLPAPAAHAQPTGSVTDIEVPTLVLEDPASSATAAADEALDLANIVQSAAKGVTTVQEAPAIVTVITDDEIRDRQFQNLPELYDTVPGWSRIGIYHSTFHNPVVRGQAQAVQFLHDGLSLFDPFVNVSAATRVQPMELIKRVEFITGPGGVLWGSNSLLGILNVITKDAEDVEGVEVGGSLGHGNGDRKMARAYVMAGKSDLLGGRLKAFGHGSVETYQGMGSTFPLLLFHGALPQPNSANVYGPLTEADQAQSLLVNLSAKLTFGKLQLRVSAPFGRKYNPAGLSGNPSRDTLPDDERCPAGEVDPTCADPLRTSRKNREDVFDRYAVAEYRTRFAKEKAGITARTYLIEFVRGFQPLQVLAPSALIQGGLAFQADLTSYRAGAAFDGDVEVSNRARLLYGAEAFREWKPDNVTGSRQGEGTQSELLAPYDLTRLPLLCPRIYDATTMRVVPVAGCPLTFAFPADRTVLGAYVNPQYRPNKQLIFDLGGRLQVAPESLGKISYPLNTTLSGSFVWNFTPGWHVKLNYAQGFRPPVFNNTASNGEGVQIGGTPTLTVETSDAAQAEINARIYKGARRIRELSFRVDGSYTRIKNQIQITSGHYENSGERGLASAELLAKLYVQGGHRLELSYTYLRGDTSDKGRLRALPEHWFELATVFNVVTDKLSATTRLKVTGAAEDPNRLVEYRGASYDEMGEPVGSVSVAATDLVLDRLPPVAELSLGLQYSPTPKLAIRATAYNALVSHAYQADVYSDYEPHLEYLPNPYEGFRAYLSAMYQY
ncbi:MAG: TonB-dependent receptor [Deltaproteobacteria bacterium]|nr:TonB-dependent receptor [Deltaproteobacteria bacterium]